MKPRILVTAGLSLAVLIIAGAVVLNLLTGQAETTAAPPAVSAASSPAAASATAATAAATETKESAAEDAVPGGEATAAVPANPQAPAATPDPNRPLEVIAPAAESTSPTLPKSRADGPLIALPLPGEASAEGALVAGFPAQVIDLEPSSLVESSSVSSQDSILQLSLVARSPAEPLAVMAFYQKQFSALGLGAAQAPASTGSAAMWFTRGTDKITVTTTPHQDGGTEYSIFGVLHAGS